MSANEREVRCALGCSARTQQPSKLLSTIVAAELWLVSSGENGRCDISVAGV